MTDTADTAPTTAVELAELAMGCADIWLAALRCYYSDCRSAARGIRTAHTEALDDLTGSRELLANLCRPLDADAERVAALMLEALDAGRRWTMEAPLAGKKSDSDISVTRPVSDTPKRKTATADVG